MTRRKPLDLRVGIGRENDLALLAAGHETGWWDEHGVPAPWPEDFFHPNTGCTCGSGYVNDQPRQNGDEPPF